MGGEQRATGAFAGRPEDQRRRAGIGRPGLQADRRPRNRARLLERAGPEGHGRGPGPGVAQKGGVMDATSPKPTVPRPKSSGVVVPHRARWHQRLGAALVYGFIRCVAATVRFRMEDGSGLFRGAPPERIIFSIWHNRLALSLIMYRRYVVRFAPERRLAAMVSASRDGGLLARILEHFRVEPVRGSSSRRGPQALREMLSWAERGHDLAITPDGPRGPCYKVQEGV